MYINFPGMKKVLISMEIQNYRTRRNVHILDTATGNMQLTNKLHFSN